METTAQKNSVWWLVVGCVGPFFVPFVGVALGIAIQSV